MGDGMVAGGAPANKMLHRGDQIDYTRAADTVPGTMVNLSGLIGLDSQGGANGTVGSLAIEGVVDLSDAGAVNPAIGATVGYDFSTQQITAAGLGDANVGKVVATITGRAHVKLIPAQ